MFHSYLMLILLIHNTVSISELESAGKPNSESFLAAKHRKLLSEVRHPKSGNRSQNDTKTAKTTPTPSKDYDSVAGTEVAVLFIVIIVVLSVIGMVIYFIRKFDQLNRSLPTYRYSSLKTEINGYDPDDDKNESQALVNVSTEEEDDDDEEEDLVNFKNDIKPPTLLVQSQTVQSSKHVNGTIPVSQDIKISFPNSAAKSAESSIDSDDELLQ